MSRRGSTAKASAIRPNISKPEFPRNQGRQAKPLPIYSMPNPINLTGKQFGVLTVVSRGERSKNGWLWVCLCECGTAKQLRSDRLQSRAHSACTCHWVVRAAQRRTSGPRVTWKQRAGTYSIWSGMRSRCLNPDAKDFNRYGGRGVTICDEWKENFDAFVADMGLRPSQGHSLDRIDNNGPYSKENCRWATKIEQARNARNNHSILRSDGVRFNTLVEAAEAIGVSYEAFRSAVKRGTREYGGFGWSDAP